MKNSATIKNSVTIITEGNFDAAVLDKLLKSRYDDNIKILPANGYSSALSKVKSLLSQQTENKIILLLDTDTTDQREIAEKKDFVHSYIDFKKNKNHIKTVWAIPEFEIIFLTNKRFMDELIHDDFDTLTLEIGKNAPRKMLESVSELPRKDYLQLLDKREIADDFFNTGVIKEISDFIEA